MEEGSRAMGLSSGQRRHLISAYATVSHLLRQMEEAGTEGRSPTGVGAPLGRLPADEVNAVCGPLREMQARLRERAAALAPEELAAFEQPQSAPNTRVWLSNLLEKIRGTVESLAPREMRSYGTASDHDEDGLAALQAEMLAKIHRARTPLDEHRPRRP